MVIFLDCRSQWHYASIYESEAPIRYRNLFLQLDEGTLTFNADAEQVFLHTALLYLCWHLTD